MTLHLPRLSWVGGSLWGCTTPPGIGPKAQAGPGEVPPPSSGCLPWRLCLQGACCQWVAPSHPGLARCVWPGVGRQLGRPLVKGNNPVQQANRPFPGGRRDLISDHKVGWRQGDSVLPRAEGGGQSQGRCPTPSAPDAMEPHSRLRGIKWDWWRDWAGFTRQEETGRCSLAPLAPPQQC